MPLDTQGRPLHALRSRTRAAHRRHPSRTRLQTLLPTHRHGTSARKTVICSCPVGGVASTVPPCDPAALAPDAHHESLTTQGTALPYPCCHAGARRTPRVSDTIRDHPTLPSLGALFVFRFPKVPGRRLSERPLLGTGGRRVPHRCNDGHRAGQYFL